VTIFLERRLVMISVLDSSAVGYREYSLLGSNKKVYKLKDLYYHQNVYTYSAEDNNVTARFTTDICSHERTNS
jgi:hypothetical protein